MKSKAFTLIELLVVVAIIGILSGFVIVQMNGAINAANDGKKKANLSSIKKALIVYGVENGNSYPIESGCTIGSCTTLDPALSSLLPQNLNGTYTYESDGSSFSVSSILSSGYAYSYDSVTNSFTTEEPTAGSCGTASKTYLYTETTYGSDTFCIQGTANPSSPSFPELGSSTNWTCPGSNGGTTANCTASRGATPTSGSCGTKDGKYASIEPTETQACLTGTITNMTGTYSWTCAGSNGGDSPSCATVAATYTVVQFTTVGTTTWTVPTGVTSVEYLVVAGGGGGAIGAYYGRAGGGGGGVVMGTKSVSGTVNIVVGSGGTAQGGNSVLNDVTALGGGDANAVGDGGMAGGSGSGGNSRGAGGNWPGGAATQTNSGGGIGYGNPGGSAYYIGSGNNNGGGGGGAGAAGQNATASYSGAGGAGISSSITGTATYYGGGGGGLGNTGPSGAGGLGGGGASGVNGTSGLGGGGGALAGGGSGIIIIKYVNNN
ncbi:MAG: type II secretion system protein [Candidatus Paceibacterota bacterium]